MSARRCGGLAALTAALVLASPSLSLGQPPESGGADDEAPSDEADGWSDEDEAWAGAEGEAGAEAAAAPGDGEADDAPAAAAEAPEDRDRGDAGREGDGEATEDGDGEATEDGEGPEGATQVVEGQAEGLTTPGRTTTYRPPAEPEADGFNLILPPLFYDRRGRTESLGLFPLFYLRNTPESREVVIPPYYRQHGRDNWDVLFPLFLWYRGTGHHTWVIPPVHSHRAPDGFDLGLSPLFYFGRHADHFYRVIPPLLFFDFGVDDEERFTLATLYWRAQERNVEHWGIFPLLWVENTPQGGYIIQPPFLFRFRNDQDEILTVVPPFYHRRETTGSYYGIPPLFHHNSGEGHTSTTVFPLLSHFSRDEHAFRLTLLGVFWYWRDHEDETLVTPLYQRFRGATEMDAVAPFFFSIRDPRDGSSRLVIPPLIWNFEDPGSASTVVFPFFARFEERGRKRTWITPLVANHRNLEVGNQTTWVFPTLQISQWRDGDAVNFHPIFYYESVASHRHSVLFPFWWDFEDFTGERDRYTVAFPFFWRFRDGITTSTLVLNLYHQERRRRDRSSWEFHIFPLLSWGGDSDGNHWWKFLYGLFGFERRGPRGFTTLSYITFQTGGPPIPPTDP